jgi:hypothetical protein
VIAGAGFEPATDTWEKSRFIGKGNYLEPEIMPDNAVFLILFDTVVGLKKVSAHRS